MHTPDLQRIRTAAKEMRADVIRMTYKAGALGAHIGGGLSLVEIMAALYAGVMRFDAENPRWPQRDRLILSKGHGALAMYAAMAQAGFIAREELDTYKANGSFVTAHPQLMPEKGMEFASGSLGQGLSLGVGVCLGLRLKGNDTSRVFVVHGDGECDEGSVWEAAASAAHYKLNNLVSIVDCNKLQYDGETAQILNMEDMEEKWRGFGFEARRVNGHDLAALCEALQKPHEKPLCVIADTIKGKGVSFVENDYKWHNARLSQAQYEQAMAEQEVWQ